MRSDNVLFVHINKKWEGSALEVDMKMYQIHVSY